MSTDKVLRLLTDKLQVWTLDKKFLDHVGFVPRQSTDKIGDLSIDNRGFCLQVCTKPNTERRAEPISKF